LVQRLILTYVQTYTHNKQIWPTGGDGQTNQQQGPKSYGF